MSASAALSPQTEAAQEGQPSPELKYQLWQTVPCGTASTTVSSAEAAPAGGATSVFTHASSSCGSGAPAVTTACSSAACSCCCRAARRALHRMALVLAVPEGDAGAAATNPGRVRGSSLNCGWGRSWGWGRR